jgi:hypothetical protein
MRRWPQQRWRAARETSAWRRMRQLASAAGCLRRLSRHSCSVACWPSGNQAANVASECVQRHRVERRHGEGARAGNRYRNLCVRRQSSRQATYRPSSGMAARVPHLWCTPGAAPARMRHSRCRPPAARRAPHTPRMNSPEWQCAEALRSPRWQPAPHHTGTARSAA